MAPRTDRVTRIPSGVASPVTTNRAEKGSVCVSLRNSGNLKIDPNQGDYQGDYREPIIQTKIQVQPGMFYYTFRFY